MISRRIEAHAAHNLALLQQLLEDQSHNDAKALEETERVKKANKRKGCGVQSQGNRGAPDQAVTMLLSDRNGAHSEYDAIHPSSGELKK